MIRPIQPFTAPHIALSKGSVFRDFSTAPSASPADETFRNGAFLEAKDLYGAMVGHNNGFLYCGGQTIGKIYKRECLQFCPTRLG